MKPRAIRGLLAQLSALGLLIDYTVHMRYGQTVMIRGIGRRPHVVSLGVARAAAMAEERRVWWG